MPNLLSSAQIRALAEHLIVPTSGASLRVHAWFSLGGQIGLLIEVHLASGETRELSVLVLHAGDAAAGPPPETEGPPPRGPAPCAG